MINFNLQWFAYLCWVLAVLLVVHALYIVAITIGESDFVPLLGLGIGFRNIVGAAVSSGLGYLIWRAFRP